MSLDNFKTSATNLHNIENEILATKRQGMNSTDEQNEELLQAMDETLSFAAEAMNDGYSLLELARATQDLIEVDVDDVFGEDDDDVEEEYDDDQEW